MSDSSGQHPFTDAQRGPRLQKVLAAAGVGSRRTCEALVEAGEITVNGHRILELPAWVDPEQDNIVVNGRPLRRAAPPVYVMLNKPRGVVCTNDDPEGRRRAIDLVLHPSKARLYPIGRLDYDSTGLLLLTNDGPLAHRLTHPRFGIHKIYEVVVGGKLDEAAIARLQRGLFLPNRRVGGARRTTRSRLEILRSDRDRTRLRIEIREGRNRQVRRMLAHVGYRVKRLERIRLGPLRLRGLGPGEWRDLTPSEVAALRRAAGLPTARPDRGPRRSPAPDRR